MNMASSNGDAEHYEVAIVGTGFAGIGAAIRLKKAGIEDVILLERADDLGGTWRDNHYPGLCCDIPSHVYSFSFALNKHWTRGFAPGWEIQAYLRHTAAQYAVTPKIRFSHEVLDASWDPEARLWRIHTSAGRFTSKFLVSAAGALSEPRTPDLPGLDRFEGKVFHSALWDHDHDLADERVAVVGTGASAIQFVPAIQPEVGRLDLYQRTPAWVIPRLDHQITGAEHFLLRWIPGSEALVRGALYWVLESRVVGFRRPPLMKVAERVARRHLNRQVSDGELRRKLTPDYTIGCKRILISDDYYPALDEPNVDVVTDGIAEIRERSIVSGDGSEREIDTIILGTGFHVTDPPIAERLRGRDGRTLAEHWAGGSMQAYLGTTISGFPNLFFLVGPNTGLGHNSMVFMVESQLKYVVDCLRTLRSHGAETVEVRREVEDAYNDWLQDHMRGTVWTAGHCQSWYLDEHGRNTTLWPSYSWSFRRRTRRFDPESYVLGPSS